MNTLSDKISACTGAVVGPEKETIESGFGAVAGEEESTQTIKVQEGPSCAYLDEGKNCKLPLQAFRTEIEKLFSSGLKNRVIPMAKSLCALFGVPFDENLAQTKLNEWLDRMDINVQTPIGRLIPENLRDIYFALIMAQSDDNLNSAFNRIMRAMQPARCFYADEIEKSL